MEAPESLDDFVLFVFLHMGHVDGSLHPTEKDTILEKMRTLFPTHSGLEEKFRLMESEYIKLGSEAAEVLIKSGSQSYSEIDRQKRIEIYTTLFDIINANGKVNSEETQTLRLLRVWLMPE